MPHILIAEDDTILRKRLIRAITNKNAEVVIHEADNAEEAMNIMKELSKSGLSMDLVITDIQMPKSGGLMLLAFLNAFASQVPCFVMTSYGTSRLKSKMPSDLLRFYDKPFDIDEMAASAIAASNRKRHPNPAKTPSVGSSYPRAHIFLHRSHAHRVAAP